MLSDAKMRVLMGPVGSGKSVVSTMEVLRRAMMQTPNADGIRKTRAAVIRETVRQLQDTTIKTFHDWLPPNICGSYMRTTKTYTIKIGDVECEIMFRALDEADDVANLNSLELTFAWFNECRDIKPEIIDAMSKRIGRYPPVRDGGPSWSGMWGDTNPPVMDSWWYYQMEKLDPEDGVSFNDNGWDVFKQPSGRSFEVENLDNLPKDYYDTQGRSEEYIRVFIDGEYGLTSAGQPIYKYFNPEYHMSKKSLEYNPNSTRGLIIGMDLGLTPAAVIGQMDAMGKVLILDEVVSFDMGAKRFARSLLKPLLFKKFPGVPCIIVVDPSGVRRSEADEKTAIGTLRKEGFNVIPACTNDPSVRIGAVDDYLMQQVDGGSAFLVDPCCTKLKAAMMGGYRFHPKNGGIDKNSKHSHIAEALQYLMLHIGSTSGAVNVAKRRDVRRADSGGWT